MINVSESYSSKKNKLKHLKDDEREELTLLREQRDAFYGFLRDSRRYLLLILCCLIVLGVIGFIFMLKFIIFVGIWR